jgi:hypothetical protein
MTAHAVKLKVIAGIPQDCFAADSYWGGKTATPGGIWDWRACSWSVRRGFET